ncbi:SDR family oxidoreductase [Alicyclobacillus sp. SO9]|uniref:SDR family oxidoreductase n=1 Tax=Alicyclobacillus sp. SO9 TaxID=2665646 RepID=UPI0018E7F5F5|nr:SDR family oxidoreductase [Alicyclobacillus sp. SO9]QQE77826.1 SDR family oxidoreductase [Alicyclobacillus sp. SO9]
MDLKLAGKSVLVTAASKGLGKACAIQFAREGASVTIASRDETNLRDAAADIERETGMRVHTCVLDVRKNSDIERAIDTAVAATGSLDVLVTNAGGPPAGGFSNFSDDDWEDAFNLNLMSMIRLVRSALPHLRAGNGGRIVSITSSSIRQPIDNLILSNTIRAGVHALTKSLASELASDNILVNTVAPGRILTDRVIQLDTAISQRTGMDMETVRNQFVKDIPVGRYGDADEFAKAVVFLSSFSQSYITGQALLVDGGMIKAL